MKNFKSLLPYFLPDFSAKIRLKNFGGNFARSDPAYLILKKKFLIQG